MKHRFLAAILALTMLLCALPVTAAAEDARVYGTVPMYIGYVDVDYMTAQLLEEIDPQGATDRERILAVYNWIIENCDREGAADTVYFDEEEVFEQSNGAFLRQMEDGLEAGSILIRMDIASSLQQDSFFLPYDSSYYIASFGYQMMMYRVGNCAHYSALLNLLLGHMGYDCRLIDGEFINSNGSRVEHKWNMVLLDGKYYWLDVRMDHANYVRTGTLNHQYFLVDNNAQWEQKHSWDPEYSDAMMASAPMIVESYGLLAKIPGMVQDAFEEMDPWAKCSETWAVPYLEKAVEKGIYPDILLQTDMTSPITREEFAAVAVAYYEALTGQEATLAVDTVNPFTDVTTEMREVLLAYQLGIVNGLTPTTFGPRSFLTREQAATMLGRVAELVQTGSIGDGSALAGAPLTFTDTGAVGAWSANYVKFFVGNGAIGGMGDGTFAPRANMTREQAMKVAVVALGE